jgi:hypothetical protein
MDKIQPAPLMLIPIEAIGKSFEIPMSMYSKSSSSLSDWTPGPNGMSKEKQLAAKARKKLPKKLRKRGKQHS